MTWLIFILHLIFFSWLITRMGFIRRSGLSRKLLIGLFVIKITAGIAYFQFHSLASYRDRSDTLKFYNSSLAETKVLKKDPAGFFSNIFTSGYPTTGGLFSDQDSYWNDVKDTLMIKAMAIMNVFTFNNYYANIIYFNFIFFIGLIAFYRLMKRIYPAKRYGLVVAIFLVPSFLFWCSGIHKDGLIFSCIGIILYCFHHLLHHQKVLPGMVAIIFSFAIIFLLRNYLALVMIVSLLAGGICHVWPRKKLIALLMFFICGAGLFFLAKHMHSSLDFPAYVVDKQQQFKKLEGNSSVKTADLQPNAASFLRHLPKAIDLGFFRPHPGEKGFISVIASVEIIFFWLLIIVCFIYRDRKLMVTPVVISCLVFALLTLLIIGYTVHFSGAVVRYRSLVLPLILAPAIGIWLPPSYIIKKYI